MFHRSNFDNLKVVVGTHNLSTGAGGVGYSVDKVIRHPFHNKPTFANDIALIKVTEDIQFSDLVKQIDFSPYEVAGNESLLLSNLPIRYVKM